MVRPATSELQKKLLIKILRFRLHEVDGYIKIIKIPIAIFLQEGEISRLEIEKSFDILRNDCDFPVLTDFSIDRGATQVTLTDMTIERIIRYLNQRLSNKECDALSLLSNEEYKHPVIANAIISCVKKNEYNDEYDQRYVKVYAANKKIPLVISKIKGIFIPDLPIRPFGLDKASMRLKLINILTENDEPVPIKLLRASLKQTDTEISKAKKQINDRFRKHFNIGFDLIDHAPMGGYEISRRFKIMLD